MFRTSLGTFLNVKPSFVIPSTWKGGKSSQKGFILWRFYHWVSVEIRDDHNNLVLLNRTRQMITTHQETRKSKVSSKKRKKGTQKKGGWKSTHFTSPGFVPDNNLCFFYNNRNILYADFRGSFISIIFYLWLEVYIDTIAKTQAKWLAFHCK